MISWVDFGDVFYVSSSNNGDSWSSKVEFESLSSSLNYMPELIFNEGRFHAICQTRPQANLCNIHRAKTESWSDTVTLTQAKSGISYTPVISADGPKLYAAWSDSGNYDGDSSSDYDIVGAISEDNGDLGRR